MFQLVLGKSHGEAGWLCAVHVLTLGRTDLLGNLNAWPLGTSFRALSNQMSNSSVSS